MMITTANDMAIGQRTKYIAGVCRPQTLLLPDLQRQLSMLKWGLVPSWADDRKVGYSMINARAETVATKPTLRRV